VKKRFENKRLHVCNTSYHFARELQLVYWTEICSKMNENTLLLLEGDIHINN